MPLDCRVVDIHTGWLEGGTGWTGVGDYKGAVGGIGLPALDYILVGNFEVGFVGMVAGTGYFEEGKLAADYKAVGYFEAALRIEFELGGLAVWQVAEQLVLLGLVAQAGEVLD